MVNKRNYKWAGEVNKFPRITIFNYVAAPFLYRDMLFLFSQGILEKNSFRSINGYRSCRIVHVLEFANYHLRSDDLGHCITNERWWTHRTVRMHFMFKKSLKPHEIFIVSWHHHKLIKTDEFTFMHMYNIQFT